MTSKNSKYIRQSPYDANIVQYSIDNKSSWIDILNWPHCIEESNAYIDSDIEFSPMLVGSDSECTNLYFIANNDLILCGNGFNLNIKDIDSYGGLIKNYDLNMKEHNLNVYDLSISATNSNLYSDNVDNGAGLFVHTGTHCMEKYITISNCLSKCEINRPGTGGFVGSNLKCNSKCNLKIRNCVNMENVSNGTDGFVGDKSNKNVVIESCYNANGNWNCADAINQMDDLTHWNISDGAQELKNYVRQIENPIEHSSNYANSKIQNILFIDQNVNQSEIFKTSVNDSTMYITYGSNSSVYELVKIINSIDLANCANGKNIERIGFVFDNSSMNDKEFINSKCFFTENDLMMCDQTYSSNCELMIWIIKKLKVTNVDFLACESLLNSNWVKYYELLQKETGVVIGASNNLTGNLKNGGDWILETTEDDIKNIYWSENINKYEYTLAALTISQSGATIYVKQTDATSLIQYSSDNANWNNVNKGDWPVTFVNTHASDQLTVRILTDITINTNVATTAINGHFIVGSDNITFDGSGNLITIDRVTNYLGFIKNVTSGRSNIIVRKLGTYAINSSTLAASAGWLLQSNFGLNGTCIIDGCSNDANISAVGCGGICGSNLGSGGNITITNCYNGGDIVLAAAQSGGICGSSAGCNSATLNISHCYNSGDLIADDSGGICGINSAATSSTVTISECNNLGLVKGGGAGGFASTFGNRSRVTISECTNGGNVDGSSAGGILGRNSVCTSGNLIITNCHNTGRVNDAASGGMFGYGCLNTYTSCTMTLCDTTGEIKSSSTGGMFGRDCVKIYSTITVANCNNTGKISGSSSGGIFGFSCVDNHSSAIITNCYNKGVINGTHSGGIAGAGFVQNYSELEISDCYNDTSGSIAGSSSGGLFGSQCVSAHSVATLTNCTNGGNITGSSCGGIAGEKFGQIDSEITATNCTNSGNVGSSACGGITGPNFGDINCQVTLQNCSNSGTISGNCGGVFSTDCMNRSTATITSCNNTGTIRGDNAGGITGPNFGNGGAHVTFTTCYNTGTISGINAGGMLGKGSLFSSSDLTITDCYNTGGITSSLGAGGICGYGCGYGSVCTITNCYNTGDLSGNGVGGIFGSGSVCTSGSVIIQNCYNNGIISGANAGGIFGKDCIRPNSHATIESCYNTGLISGANAGGILGGACAATSSSITMTNCKNTGNITGAGSGGIAGNDFGQDRTRSTVTKCSNSGIISGQSAGGICGQTAICYTGVGTFANCSNSGNILSLNGGGILGREACNRGNLTVQNCTNYADTSGENSGGIVGAGSGIINGFMSISECCSLGQILSSYAGGIVGANCCDGSGSIVNIDKCYSVGNISGKYAGGLVGSSPVQTHTSTLRVTNSYTLGGISYKESGGIIGGLRSGVNNNALGSITVTNCYSKGVNIVTNSVSNGIYGLTTFTVTTVNCYTANGTWNDTDAAAALINGPTYSNAGGLTVPNGSVWIDIAASSITPWKFSSFGYSPYTTDSSGTFSEEVIQPGGVATHAIDTSGYTYTMRSINDQLPDNYANVLSMNSANGLVTTSEENSILYVILVEKLNNQNSTYTMTKYNLKYLNPPKVRISSQPIDTSCIIDQVALFEVDASGNGAITYQWYSNVINSTSGATLLANENGRSISINVTATTATYYYVMITDTVRTETDTVASNIANLQIIPLSEPTIKAQPEDTICYADEGCNFSVDASGNGEVTYQWYANNIRSYERKIELEGQTSATLQINLDQFNSGQPNLVNMNNLQMKLGNVVQTIETNFKKPDLKKYYWVEITDTVSGNPDVTTLPSEIVQLTTTARPIFTTRGNGVSSNIQTQCVEMKNPIVAVGQGTSTLAYSMNGIKWTSIGKQIFSECGNSVGYDGQMWIAVGKNNMGQGKFTTMGISYDCVEWQILDNDIFDECKGIESNGEMWVAVGNGSNTIAWSTDGLAWNGLGKAIFSTTGINIKWNGKMWIAVGSGSNTIAWSTDGLEWTGLGNNVFSVAGNGVEWNGQINKWVAVGSGTNTIATSEDGLTWSGLGTSIFTTEGMSVKFNGERMFAVGEGLNTIAMSFDGIQWLGSGELVYDSKCNHINWNGKYWISGGDGINNIAISTDGFKWTKLKNAIFEKCNGMYVRSNMQLISIKDKIHLTGGGNLNIVTDKYNNAGPSNLSIKIISSEMK